MGPWPTWNVEHISKYLHNVFQGQVQGQRSVVHRMRFAMGYDFASLRFDLETQLKCQICNFVMKLTI